MEGPPEQCTSTSGVNLRIDLEQVTPIGRAVVQFLQRKRQGAKLNDIVKQLSAERRDRDDKLLDRQVPEVLKKGVALGLLEKKRSRYTTKVPGGEEPADGCRRRRPRRCACTHRRHCCDRPLTRRRRRS